MALTKGVQRQGQSNYRQDIVTLYSNENKTILEGSLLTFKADGSVKSSTAANEKFAGYADETKVVGSTLTPIRVKRHGLVWLPWTNPTAANVGDLVSSDADDAIVAYSASKTFVGRIVDFNTEYGRSEVLVDTDDRG